MAVDTHRCPPDLLYSIDDDLNQTFHSIRPLVMDHLKELALNPYVRSVQEYFPPFKKHLKKWERVLMQQAASNKVFKDSRQD